MKTFIISVLLLLSGCMYQSIEANDIKLAQKKCAETSTEVVKIKSYLDSGTTVRCSDNKVYSF